MKGKSESEVAESCPTLSDPVDCSPPGSSVHGIFQARALEWGAIAFSKPTYSTDNLLSSVPLERDIRMLPKTNQNFLMSSWSTWAPCSVFLWWFSHQTMSISWVQIDSCDQTCLCTAWSGCKGLLRKRFTCSITLQIGFMNNGVIKAADIEYYINGGCTPDESELVNKKYTFPISYHCTVLLMNNHHTN